MSALRRWGRGWGATLACAAALWLAAPGLAVGAAAGDLLSAAERAPLTVVGTVHDPERVDLHGRAATLAVETVLAGELEAGGRLRFAWEELGAEPGDPLLRREGERVLVALEPRPSLSLWKRRFPQQDVWAVAARGGALLRNPAASSAPLLGAYLGLPPAARAGAPGAAALARMVAEAEPALALQALARAEALAPQLPAFEDAAAGDLARTLGDPARPRSLRARVLALVGAERLASLRGAVEALAGPSAQGPGSEAPLEAEAVEALARLDAGLEPARVQALLARPPGDPVRPVAVRHGGSALALPTLARLVREDPDAAVRAAAVARLVSQGGSEAVEAAAPALVDADPQVVSEAVRGLGTLGAPAVPRLLSLAESLDPPQVAAPIAALSLAGAHGVPALRRLAEGHRDPRARELAKLALGQPLERDPH